MSSDDAAPMELDKLLLGFDEADAALRAIYRDLVENPDLAAEYEPRLRELHGQRLELTQQVGLATLAARKAMPAAPPAPSLAGRPVKPNLIGPRRVVGAAAILSVALGVWLLIKPPAPTGSSAQPLGLAPSVATLPPAEPTASALPSEHGVSATPTPTLAVAAPIPAAPDEKTPSGPKGVSQKKPQPPASISSVASAPAPAPSPTAADDHSSTVNCDPLFIIDANGIEHVKPGCL
jgi:hypothetical protein